MNEALQQHNRTMMASWLTQITMSHADRSIRTVCNAIANGRIDLKTGNAQIEAIKELNK